MFSALVIGNYTIKHDAVGLRRLIAAKIVPSSRKQGFTPDVIKASIQANAGRFYNASFTTPAVDIIPAYMEDQVSSRL